MAGKGGVCPAGQGQLQDSSDSDSEPEGVPARVAGTGPSCGSLLRTQVIHSGHFMVSSPHRDSVSRRRKSGGSLKYDFDTVNRTWCQTYRYGPFSSGSLSIDPTLTRLFECMSLAYSGKIVSPKWKSFKGLRLLWRDKIRLNNAIWRAWFIQYVEKRKNTECGFVTPLEGSEADAHRKPEAIVLEGSYWKRRIEVVIKEYHKWRIYYKKRVRKKDDIFSMLQEDHICQARLEKWSNQMYQQPEAAPVEAHMFDLDCLLSDISDTLFTMTQKPCPWASDRHNTYTSNADMIQPGLTPLQPNLDDFMDIPGTLYLPTYLPFCLSVSLAQVLISLVIHQNRPGRDCGKYQTPNITSGSMPYGHQSFSDLPASEAFTTSIEQPASSGVPFFYPLPCNKFGYYPTSSVASTVITHTASSVGTQVSVSQAHSFPHTGEAYPQNPFHSLSYPAAVSDPDQTTAPSVSVPHYFSVPEQVAVTGVRGKHSQKTGGVRSVSTSGSLPGPQSNVSTSTSCLAKLLSSGARERKPSLGFDTTLGPAKGQRSTSPSSAPNSSSHVGGAGWPAGIPALTPLHSQGGTLAWGGPSTSRGLAVSTLLTHGSSHTSSTLLVPKTEKLSPVQLHGTDRSTLTVNCPEHLGRTSPPNLLDKASNPESPQSETRRITHISAEQKRRFNIKLGFDTLHNLVTTLSSQPSIKISKATTLQKTAEYISKMQQERAQLHEEAQRLREEIQILNSAINVCQQQLPATGVPITRQRFDHMRQKFREYVQAQTLQNWKFWIFSIIIEPLFESYNGMVSTASVEDLCRSTLSWLDQHCSLPSLRPMVLRSLRLLSTTTAILTEPRLLPEQAALAVTQSDPTAAQENSVLPATRDHVPPM
uniref:Carbohydrate-responsive element-binding protein-like n=1 Tax=Echeneis naucrates TaxID=173247 RepID=A0A665U8U1_ECHNA